MGKDSWLGTDNIGHIVVYKEKQLKAKPRHVRQTLTLAPVIHLTD